MGGVNSPVRAFRAVGGKPVLIDRAIGPYVHDVDGHRYIDLVGGWGPAIAGHAHPQVIEAVTRAASSGLSFGATCDLELELAELIKSALSSIELIRFVNSGTEATMSAIRLARAATGREKIVKFLGGYHGHVDSLLVAAGSGAATFGVPDSAGVSESVARLTLLATYNDVDAVRTIFETNGNDIAAIIVEPVAGNMGMIAPVGGFLAGLRTLCDRFGALLIFDEVMTGFRVTWGGYQNTCNVMPDITCLGKSIGGGMPVAAFGGSQLLMSQMSPTGPVYQAGTLSGNPVAMAAGLATLQLCRTQGFYDGLSQASHTLVDGLRAVAAEVEIPLHVDAIGGLMGLAFTHRPPRNFADAKSCDHARYAQFFTAMLDHGVWLPPSGFEALFVSAAHESEHIDTVIKAARDVLSSLEP